MGATRQKYDKLKMNDCGPACKVTQKKWTSLHIPVQPEHAGIRGQVCADPQSRHDFQLLRAEEPFGA